MLAKTIFCPDHEKRCNISLVWKDAREECIEFEECPYPYFPCNVTGCQKDILPMPGWCHDFVCWSIPPGPVPPSPSPMTPVGIGCGIVGLLGFFICLTAACIYRKSPFIVSLFGCLKTCGIKMANGLEWFAFLLWSIFLCCLLPFAFVLIVLRDSMRHIYGKIRFRNE